MLIFLILQATAPDKPANLDGVYIALFGTLVAAVIAATASIYNSKETSAITKKAQSITEDVAKLSAQVARESAALAARTAQEVKDKEYKNDYYKKIIEKRMKAIEYAEHLTSLFIGGKTKNGFSYYVYFTTHLNDNTYADAFSQVLNSALWYSSRTFSALNDFNTEVGNTLREARKHKELADIIDYAGTKHNDIKTKRDYVIKCIGDDMPTLHDIDDFLKSKFSSDSIFFSIAGSKQ